MHFVLILNRVHTVLVVVLYPAVLQQGFSDDRVATEISNSLVSAGMLLLSFQEV